MRWATFRERSTWDQGWHCLALLVDVPKWGGGISHQELPMPHSSPKLHGPLFPSMGARLKWGQAPWPSPHGTMKAMAMPELIPRPVRWQTTVSFSLLHRHPTCFFRKSHSYRIKSMYNPVSKNWVQQRRIALARTKITTKCSSQPINSWPVLYLCQNSPDPAKNFTTN